MSDFLQRISNLSPDRLRLLAAELKTRLERAEGRLAARDEPIAVVGVGCRFPGGGDSPDGYWRLLRDGVDAVTEVPSERWDTSTLFSTDPDSPGKATSRWGSFLNGLEDFDPWFFGISPREALGMDPQQRVLLEVVWEALENAGIAPESLEGTPTGVFLGLCNHDFHALRLERPYEEIDSYFASGVAGSMAAGRISYLLGLHGPSFTVDTACSSSLVALHQACESIRSGESRMALAAGVSLILTPETMIGLSKSRILSGDGRCRTFDADAGGIARGEGCGVVVLKRLSDARADGDRVLALVRATGINQDGRSNGITAPNGPAQESLLRQTLARSGLSAADIDYVEAHGTGTTLGDPIEVRALASVYGDRPADRPLRIGSVKTNMGHLEASAGIAGFIKVVLAMQAREIPPHLHLTTPNPHIEWDRLPIRVTTELAEWTPATPETPLRGAVSAFGFSGTNAHAILEQAPEEPSAAAPGEDRSAQVLVISARTEALLRQLAERYVERLEHARSAELADICHTAATGRNHFAFRLAVAGEDPAAMAASLSEWLATGESTAVRAGRAAAGNAAEPVFVFTGQGSQSVGMGRGLYETESVFRAAMGRCDALLRDELPIPLLEALYGEGASAEGIDRTDMAQPALFALEYSLAELWRSWGVEPVAVIGHSLGEYVAATVAGLMTLEDGLRLVARRGRLMQALPAGGAMASVFAELSRVEAAIEPHRDVLAIAAINGPENIVVSGDERALTEVLEGLEREGIASRRLVVSGAFHSPLMDPVLDEFEEIVRGVAFRTPDVAIASNLTGALARPEELTRPGYWREHLRRPVRFMEGVKALEEAGYTTFLEIGPHPTLTGLLAGALSGGDVVLASSLRRGRSDQAEMAAAAGALHVRGVPLDWRAYDRDRPRRTVSLPTTPFDRRRFWLGWSARAHGAAAAPSERGWTWELGWESAALLANPVDLDAIADRLTESAPALVEEHGAGEYDRGLPLLDRLSSALIIQGLRQLGYAPVAGEVIEPEALRERLGVRADHRRLFRRMLEILREDNFLESAGDGHYRVPRPLPEPEPARFTERLLAEAPAMRAEVELTVRCGEQLAPVLRGEADPLELLFPGGSTDEASALYGEAPSFRVFNSLVRDAVVELVAARGGQPVRILEVGGGTGGVTRTLLPALPRQGTEYHFTDISPLFISRARERFAEYPGFRGGVLDLSRDPAGQGFAEGSFDIVVASNVLHATPDIRATLSRLHTLLAPGGAVVVLEGVLPQRFGDLTVGLTDGWWSFTDTDLRPDYALMEPARWAAAFESCGFEASADMPRTTATEGVLAQQRVLLARKPGRESATQDAAARWVAVTGGGSASADVAERLRAAGIDLVTLDADTPDLGTALGRQLGSGEPVEAVLNLAALDLPTSDAEDGDAALTAQRPIVESALACTSALIGAPGPRLVLVTRGAEATTADESTVPDGASLWGLARGAALEHPELRTLALDLPADGIDAAQVIAAVRGDPREDQVALRSGGARVPRIRRAAVPASDGGPRFRPDGAYLVTGGLRGLGLRVARWMAERGAGTLVLAGRGEPDADARETIAAIEAAGATVRAVRGDVSRMDDVRRMIEAAGEVPLRGVMHSAGTTADASLASLDWDRTARVMRAKVAGSWNLHVATRDLPLDHFVLFSSGAAFLGSPGQANHAMANNVMGSIAQRRRAAGLPALSVDWGPWAEIGAATRDGVLERARAAGLDAIDPEQGLEMLGRMMLWDRARVAAVPVQWGSYLSRIPGGAERAWFDEVRPAVPAATSAAVGEASATPTAGAAEAVTAADPAYLAARLGEVVAGRRVEVALDGIRGIAGRVLGATDARDIDPSTPLTELGLDSLMAVEMRNRLAAAVGRPLPATLLFNHPSLDALAEFVVGTLGGEETAPAAAVEPAPPPEPEMDLDSMSEDEMADLLAAKLRDV